MSILLPLGLQSYSITSSRILVLSVSLSPSLSQWVKSTANLSKSPAFKKVQKRVNVASSASYKLLWPLFISAHSCGSSHSEDTNRGVEAHTMALTC